MYCHGTALPETSTSLTTLTAAVERAHVHIRHECPHGTQVQLRSIRWADDTAFRPTWVASTARRWVAVLYRGEVGSPEHTDHNHIIGLMPGEGEDDPREVVRKHGRRSEHPWFTYDSVDELLHELELTREDLGEALTTYARRTAAGYLRGDGPCGDCGSFDNVVWFTEDVLWNDVVRRREPNGDPLMCVQCFVARVHAAGYAPTGWRLLPEWHWETRSEYSARRERDDVASVEAGERRDRKVQARGRWWHPLENRWVEGDVELSDEAATSATREATRCLSIAEEFAENERVRREFADAVWDELSKVSIRRGGVEYPLTDAQRAAREWWVNRKIDVESDDDEETKR